MNHLFKNDDAKRLSPQMFIWGFAAVYSLLTYIFLREKNLSGLDPANYFLAIKYGFSLAAERPHAPGYPFFIFLGQQISSLFKVDPHSAIILFNKIFLFLSIGLCYNFVKKYWSNATAVIAVLLITCNPLVLYYGSVSEIYIYDLFFSIGILYLVMACRAKFLPLAFFVIGMSMGFRLSSVVLLAPVIALAVFFREDLKFFISFKIITAIILSFLLGICTWLIPFYIFGAGIQSFWQAMHDAGDLDSTMYQNAAAYGGYFLWSINILCIVLFIRTGKNDSSTKRKKILLFAWFIIPTLFFLFEHYAKGYILLILPSLIIPIANRISSVENSNVKRWLTAFLVLSNISLFFFSPFIPLMPESSLLKTQRSSTERMKTAFMRPFSVFAPTFLHIVIADEAIKEANSLLEKNCPTQSVILLDNSATSWAFPRSLEAANPSLFFVQMNSRDTNVVTLYHESEIDRFYSIQKLLPRDTLYYLIDTRFVNAFGVPPETKLLSNGSYLALYIVTSKEKMLFWKYFTRTK